jgi:Fic family protein
LEGCSYFGYKEKRKKKRSMSRKKFNKKFEVAAANPVLDDYFKDMSSDVDPLIRNDILHYQFESIHPFYDGNGKTGRILLILHFVLSGRLDLPILFVSGYINQHCSEYYCLLHEVTSAETWITWVSIRIPV